ncbi:glycosyltransferase [Pseudalkalibacillus hwajinpoensis]|uniref:Glycosyltransferase family 4 protein n=1 Tax=Guptibacillus hwajinpoensis TaxID=208199 RepID=A0A4U1MJ71_9BACL|nr:glycosyltransferase [Pseudalkalibacillus hwajinpoensis]TKD70857.1 glycosyltransferase family 4 protein [Pseudalkalibacillus hwajinpoensis]
MKLILATPFYHQLRGNTITVRRIAEGLNEAGIETEVISITEQTDDQHSLKTADLIHGFNAYRFYQFMKTMSTPITNYTITLTGTDLNHDLKNNERKQDVITCLKDALAVHVFDEKAKERVLEVLPELKRKLYVIAQGTSTFNNQPPIQIDQQDAFTFLLPAGIRKVKNIPFAINALQQLRQTHPQVHLKIVGPIIEPGEGNYVQQLVSENRDWVVYDGVIPHTEMQSLYNNADVVINTSHSEGQSSAVLEAMGHGLPVLVSGNKGNTSIVTHDQTGFVYDGMENFLNLARSLIEDSSLRQELGQKAAEYVENHHSANMEIKAIINMYEESLTLNSLGGK